MTLSLRIVFPEGSFLFIRGVGTTSLVGELLDRIHSLEPKRAQGQLWFQGRVLDAARSLAEEGIVGGVSLQWSPVPDDLAVQCSQSVEQLRKEALNALVPVHRMLAELATRDLAAAELASYPRLLQLSAEKNAPILMEVEPKLKESSQEIEQMILKGLALLEPHLDSLRSLCKSSSRMDQEARWRLEQDALAFRWFSDMLFSASAIASTEQPAELSNQSVGCTSRLRSMLQQLQTETKGASASSLPSTTTGEELKTADATPVAVASGQHRRLATKTSTGSSMMSTTLGSGTSTTATPKTTFRTQSTAMVSMLKRAAAPAMVRNAPVFDAHIEALLGEKETQRWRAMLARDRRYQPPSASEPLSALYRSTGRKSIGL
jgi:hypothetical protein